ncbi:MAG TPA: ABC transporter ATP-binding protein [Polyangiaceae bacterium]|jgi:putative ABC transport system ATP-binding protein|nr:ABC transporter ATP-binding protein [Polyangiaceae bacterium]
MALIELHDVHKVYSSGDEVQVHALNGIDLTIDVGEFVAVMGPSGSGKSTLMNVLGCLDRPTSGSYLLDGHDVSRMNKNQLAEIRNQTLGFVFQNFNLLPRMSAVENVELPLVYADVPARERTRRSAEALTRVGLGQRLYHHPNQLSGGQQQRVAIARALVGRPKIIFADEPTGNLDSNTSIEVMAMLQELCRAGITIAVVTHEPDIAEYASRVIVVKDGKVLSDTRREPVPAIVPGHAPATDPSTTQIGTTR